MFILRSAFCISMLLLRINATMFSACSSMFRKQTSLVNSLLKWVTTRLFMISRLSLSQALALLVTLLCCGLIQFSALTLRMLTEDNKISFTAGVLPAVFFYCEFMGYIYKITNTLNNKVYIGQTIKTVEKRWKQHKLDCRYDYKSSSHFYNALRKYGVDSFVIETLEECDNSMLNERERYWIKYYNSNNHSAGYNSTDGGDSHFTLTDEVKKKISIRKSGSNHHYYDKHLSAEHRRKIGDAQRGELGNHYGIPHTEAEKKKVKLAECVPVFCYTDNGAPYMYYLSTMAADRISNYDSAHLNHVINGHRAHAYKTDSGELLNWSILSDIDAFVIKKYFSETNIEVMIPEEFDHYKEVFNYG